MEGIGAMKQGNHFLLGICIVVAFALMATGYHYRIPSGTVGLIILAALRLATRPRGSVRSHNILALIGLAFTIPGDLCLAVWNARVNEPLFLYGVVSFAAAQICWMAALLMRDRRFPLRAFTGWGLALGIYAVVRLAPVLPRPVAIGVFIYALTTALLASLAWQSRHPAWIAGAMLLMVSDAFISYGTFLHAPGGRYVVPLYLLCLVAFAVASCTEARLPSLRLDRRALLGGVASLVCFYIAGVMASTPTEWYNPLRQMLSYLGRTEIDGVPYPSCHFWFMAGMFVSTAIVASVYGELARRTPQKWAARVIAWGGMLNATGLAIIALVPENVCMAVHNTGCNLSVAGGLPCLILLTWQRRSHWLWLVLLCGVTTAFAVILHAISRHWLPFSPYLPTAQKCLILLFMGWLMQVCRREMRPRRRPVPE